MSGLLPSLSDETPPPPTDPRVLEVGSEDFEDTLHALSAETTRDLLVTVYEEPGTSSEIADQVDTSLSNVSYHLDKLESAGLVREVDTSYSEKGHEMTVYGPANDPIVFVGDEDSTDDVEKAVVEVAGSVGLLALGGLAVQVVLDGFGTIAGGDFAGPAGETPGTPPGLVGDGVELLAQLLEPGVLFFLGGVALLAVQLFVRD